MLCTSLRKILRKDTAEKSGEREKNIDVCNTK
jgi:hypothetical protein